MIELIKGIHEHKMYLLYKFTKSINRYKKVLILLKTYFKTTSQLQSKPERFPFSAAFHFSVKINSALHVFLSDKNKLIYQTVLK